MTCHRINGPAFVHPHGDDLLDKVRRGAVDGTGELQGVLRKPLLRPDVRHVEPETELVPHGVDAVRHHSFQYRQELFPPVGAGLGAEVVPRRLAVLPPIDTLLVPQGGLVCLPEQNQQFPLVYFKCGAGRRQGVGLVLPGDAIDLLPVQELSVRENMDFGTFGPALVALLVLGVLAPPGSEPREETLGGMTTLRKDGHVSALLGHIHRISIATRSSASSSSVSTTAGCFTTFTGGSA